ncbi:outer membrane protein assembly factor BamE domain-containing protein [Altererythrobacter lutimaris]|uniref:Outer membrane protein assembly factor BamE n=1 Tax=Altererythrobacter lutimaris TaxID=2743979 RepID=A0A850H5F8_9SPHN|nr:outer membrane protein assembly factor BamE [Altererythrobacter lutimaris]NVE94397.1 outer membrane protein assembly factor BamE [Altererythrobacter lutimaris]
MFIFFAAVWASFEAGYLPTRSFDSAEWQGERPTDQYPRLEMVDDLIDSDRLDRMTRDQVYAILGTPPETSYFSDWDAVYWLGPERNYILRLDSEWLVIRFDDDDVVSEYRLVRD